MELKELISESISALTLNKMRTGLATLGIIIGIGSVIALMSLGQSSQRSVEQQIQSLGSNLLTVSPLQQRNGNVRQASAQTTLTDADSTAIKTNTQLTTVKNVSPEYQGRGQVVAGRNNTNTQIMGVTAAYAEVHKLSMASGHFISDQDNLSMNKVAVLGPQVVSDLFGDGANPLGKTVRINSQVLTVVGVTVSKGGSGFQNQDNIVYVPLSTAQKQLFGADYLTSISIEASSPDTMTATQDQVGYFLLGRHKISDPANADFSIFSQSDILGAANQITGTLTALLAGIAAISLVVGGIGIMNIMLVTVTERTREIGLRKALGAKKKIIIQQFLIESAILTFAGGVFGITIGIIVSYIVSGALKMPFTIAFGSILLAVGVSAGIGILFGLYPARKAANLQPIEALRYE